MERSPPSLFPRSFQLLLFSRVWPEQSWVSPFILLPLSLCSAWHFIKGNTSTPPQTPPPVCLISTTAQAVMADKRQQGPELRCTQHLYLLRHSLCLWWAGEGEGGENGGQAAAFTCLVIDMSHQGVGLDGHSLQWSHQSELFITPVHSFVMFTHEERQKRPLFLLLTYIFDIPVAWCWTDVVGFTSTSMSTSTSMKRLAKSN